MSLTGTISNPAHTGERRCVPCTVANLGILWLLVNAVVLLGTPLTGGLVLAVGLGVIWIRGYLVPFTPVFAPKLISALPIPAEWFHDTAGNGALSPQTENGEDLVVALERAGVLEITEQEVFLDRAFEQEWHDEMDRLASLPLSTLAAELDAESTIPPTRAYEQDGQQWIVVEGQEALVPRHVTVAELGAVRALESVIDDPADRLAMARPLREFLTECPVCEIPFEQSTEVSCCGGHTNPREKPRETLVCPECEQQFLLLPPEPSEPE